MTHLFKWTSLGERKVLQEDLTVASWRKPTGWLRTAMLGQPGKAWSWRWGGEVCPELTWRSEWFGESIADRGNSLCKVKVIQHNAYEKVISIWGPEGDVWPGWYSRQHFFFNISEMKLVTCYPLMRTRYLPEEHSLLLDIPPCLMAVSTSTSSSATL